MGNSPSQSGGGGGGGGGGPRHAEQGRAASFRAFRDSYTDVATLQNDLRRAGLESCNLIVGIGEQRAAVRGARAEVRREC